MTDLNPPWGKIDPATENPDQIIQLFGKTGVGELKWESEVSDLFDPIVAVDAEKELAYLNQEETEGEYVDTDEICL